MEPEANIKPQYIPRGCLIFAANSLGRPDDIPTRCLAALREADLLVFEEDRPARLCLKTSGIHRSYLKLTEHAESDTIDAVRESLENNQTVCYMSDQGLPNVADPGAKLLEIAYQLGSQVTVIPGPSSISTALAACPFLGRRYFYHGFLSQKSEERQHELTDLAHCPDAIVLLDTPYRLRTILQETSAAFGPERMALIAVDISGPAEDFRVASLSKLLDWAKTLEEKLNFVLIVRGTGKKRLAAASAPGPTKKGPPPQGRGEPRRQPPKVKDDKGRRSRR